MVKLIETLFRHKFLLLLPPILIPTLVAPPALLSAPVTYETYAGIWVDRPTYLSYADDWNRYITPAQNQSGRLTELLRTRSFVDDVASRTSLAPLVGSARGEDRIQKVVGDGLGVVTSGSHLLVLRFRADTGPLAYEVLNAIVEAFKDNAANDQINQAGLATSFYQSRLDDAQKRLDDAQTALRQYVGSNPRYTDPTRVSASSSATGGASSAPDPQLAELQHEVDFTQAEFERVRKSLDQASLDASASLQGQELDFQVVDTPQLPTTAVRQVKNRVVFPIAGFLGGLVLSAVLLVLLMSSDHAVRSEADLARSVRVLGAVPRLKLKRLPRRAGPDVARRAIGFMAGTALPVPSGATK
jgi:uncharacterized protein involved in exopolysaccharide biosynthesis